MDVQNELLAFVESQLGEALPQAVDDLMVVATHVHDADAMDPSRRLRGRVTGRGENTEGDQRR